MEPGATPADVAAVLKHATAGLPGHEDRPGQLRMAELVAEAIRSKTHLIVQAGTGTGKTLAYLVGSILMGEKLIVATASIGFPPMRQSLPTWLRGRGETVK